MDFRDNPNLEETDREFELRKMYSYYVLGERECDPPHKLKGIPSTLPRDPEKRRNMYSI